MSHNLIIKFQKIRFCLGYQNIKININIIWGGGCRLMLYVRGGCNYMSKYVVKSGGGGDSDIILSFKNENLLLNAAPYTSSNIKIIQSSSKVTVTVPNASNAAWFKLFYNINFKINTFYKLSVNTFGYGRIGISNKSQNPHDGINTNACVFSNASAKEGEVKGDNYLIDSGCYSAIFIINLDFGSDINNVQSGSIWFCNDLPFNEKHEGFSFEISL